MNEESELPPNVLEALKADRKIEAIKRLREHLGVGLKEAKEMVEAHEAQHPSTPIRRSPQSESGLGRLVLACMVGAVAYGLYWFIAG